MEDNNNIMIPRDCLQRAWVNSMELVRDFEMYSKNIKDSRVSNFFKEMAEKQGIQAHEFRELYNQFDNNESK